jgi:chromosome partitioning protein
MNASQHTIIVTSGKGGVGKTSLAINIAAETASLGHRVLFADFDPQGTGALVLGQVAQPGVYNALYAGEPIGEQLIEIEAKRWQTGRDQGGALWLLPGDNTTTAAATAMYMESRPLTAVVDLLHPLVGDYFDFIVIDTPPSVHSMAPYVYPAAGFAVLPTDCGLEGVDGLYRTMDNIEDAPGANTVIATIVPDRIPHSTILHDRMIAHLHKEFNDLVGPPIYQRDTWAKAAFKNQALGVYAKRSKAYSEFKFMWRNLLRTMRQHGIEVERENS